MVSNLLRRLYAVLGSQEVLLGKVVDRLRVWDVGAPVLGQNLVA